MNTQERIRLITVAGPTASGKTALAIALAKAQNGEVISADSMQVYAEPFIGTARPSEEEMAGIPHHLLGFLPLTESYSVARYAADAKAAIADVHARGKQPILCGGTGLYIQAVTENLTFSPEDSHDDCRRRLKARAASEGSAALLSELRQIDPETAARLHPNDENRILRALEVYETTGRTMTEQRKLSRQQPTPYDGALLFLDFRDRAVLYDRIDRRVDRMLEAGLLEEARRLLAAPTAATAMQAIGYKELAPYFDGALSLEEAVANLKQATRRYAKRQLSWFRRLEAHTLYVDDYATADELTAAALESISF
ncbi:MAG: tRNA (adenosine(37)-N6)-dimethylallyltransferase MiaA [Clostridia bacterium]|nr:tRNA (adenosine(37)-N6)-dimethylallyltransferase MiaA [Clostridia bacterium]